MDDKDHILHYRPGLSTSGNAVFVGVFAKPMAGVEPATPALRKPCSTIELHRRQVCEGKGTQERPKTQGPIKAPCFPYGRHGAVERGHDSFHIICSIHLQANQTKNVTFFTIQPGLSQGERRQGRSRRGLTTMGFAGHAGPGWSTRAAVLHLPAGVAPGIGRSSYGTFRQIRPRWGGAEWSGSIASRIKQNPLACRCFTGWAQTGHWRDAASRGSSGVGARL